MQMGEKGTSIDLGKMLKPKAIEILEKANLPVDTITPDVVRGARAILNLYKVEGVEIPLSVGEVVLPLEGILTVIEDIYGKSVDKTEVV